MLYVDPQLYSFLVQYNSRGVAQGYNYQKVANWVSRKCQGTLHCLLSDRYSGIKDVDKVVMPVFVGGNHWVRSPF